MANGSNKHYSNKHYKIIASLRISEFHKESTKNCSASFFCWPLQFVILEVLAQSEMLLFFGQYSFFTLCVATRTNPHFETDLYPVSVPMNISESEETVIANCLSLFHQIQSFAVTRVSWHTRLIQHIPLLVRQRSVLCQIPMAYFGHWSDLYLQKYGHHQGRHHLQYIQ